MNVNGKPYRTIWLKEEEPRTIQIIDQRNLPHEFKIENICSVTEMARAIKEMHVRGAGLIGAAAGFGMYLATLEAAKSEDFEGSLQSSYETLKSFGLETRYPKKICHHDGRRRNLVRLRNFYFHINVD